MATRPALTFLIGAVLRMSMSAVFAWAGVLKAMDPLTFQRDVASYQLLPPLATFAVAAYLPWLELVTAAALWIRAVRRGAEWLLLGLTTVFMMAIAAAWLRGLDIRCGCFGQDVGGAVGYGWLLLRDLGLLMALGVVMRSSRTSRA